MKRKETEMICPYCLEKTLGKDSCHSCSHLLTSADVLWWKMLCDYSYPADLGTFSGKSKYPRFFELYPDKRDSTINFENHFRQSIEVPEIQAAPFLEVVFWKMYSQRGRAETRTIKLIEFLASDLNRVYLLKSSINDFVLQPSVTNAYNLISACGLTSRTIALAFTFPALYKPSLYPMVDTRVARWVNRKLLDKKSDSSRLKPFHMNYTSLQMNDFDAYLCWLDWCREQAVLLDKLQPKINWRPRDVEMACFTDTAYQLPVLKGQPAATAVSADAPPLVPYDVGRLGRSSSCAEKDQQCMQ